MKKVVLQKADKFYSFDCEMVDFDFNNRVVRLFLTNGVVKEFSLFLDYLTVY